MSVLICFVVNLRWQYLKYVSVESFDHLVSLGMVGCGVRCGHTKCIQYLVENGA